MKAIKVTAHRYGWLTRYVLRQWPLIVLIFGLTAASSATAVLQPWPIKLLIDHALGHITSPTSIHLPFKGISLNPTPMVLVFLAAIGSLGLFVINSALDVGLTWVWTAAGQHMVYDLAADLFHRLQRLSLIFYSRRALGDSLSCLTGDTWCIYTVTESLISPCQYVLTLLTIGAVAWRLDSELTKLSLIIAPMLGGSAFFFGRQLKRRTRLNREAESHLMSFVQQTLASIPLVQAFSTESQNGQQFQQLASSAVVISQRGIFLKSTYELVNGLIMTTGTAIVLYIGGQRVLSGTLSIGSLIVFFSYLQSMQAAFQGLLSMYANLRSVSANIDRLVEILEAGEEVRDIPEAKPLPLHPVGERGHVRFENVTFGYDTGYPVLKDINIEASPGQTLAIVGPTGAGKSTLVSLIPRFFDPWQGRITIDGVDIRDIRLSSLRAQVSLVLQEPFLLPLTISENISYGRPGATQDEVIRCAVMANADEFIRRLPKGYDTVIGERGATLSGGEKQRLAIARALLKDAPILILDEPTSALDAQTESLLLEALEHLMKGRTTFIIAHRLSTIRQAECIVVIDKGKIVEIGTQKDLTAVCGAYKHLHALQFGPALATI